MTQTAIQRAVAVAGSQSKLAAGIGATQGLVSQWCNGAAVHPRWFEPIERKTGVAAADLLRDEMDRARKASAAKPATPKQEAA